MLIIGAAGALGNEVMLHIQTFLQKDLFEMGYRWCCRRRE